MCYNKESKGGRERYDDATIQTAGGIKKSPGVTIQRAKEGRVCLGTVWRAREVTVCWCCYEGGRGRRACWRYDRGQGSKNKVSCLVLPLSLPCGALTAGGS